MEILFNTRQDEKGAVQVCKVTGLLTSHEAPKLEAELWQKLEEGEKNFIFDFSDVISMSSQGVDLLYSFCVACRDLGGDLLIEKPTPMVKEVINVTGFHTFLRSVPEVISVATFFNLTQ